MNYHIKKSLSCKSVTDYKLDELKTSHHIPQAGDVAIFKVESIGKHVAIQADCKRSVLILPGDYIMASFGNRYATEQFEGYIPDECLEKFHILGMGGAIGIVKSAHTAVKGAGPTVIKIVAYAVNKSGEVINTKYHKETEIKFGKAPIKNSNIILSVGSSMDSGKTTTAGYLARGLKAAGLKVGFIKLTGTVFTKDKDFVFDCGADVSYDFSDMGFPSTYMCDKEELMNLYQTLLLKVNVINPDYIIVEIADGLYQRETNFLLKDSKFMSTVNSVVYSSGDSLSAVHGVQVLKEMGIKPVALSGILSMSPLLMEEVRFQCDIPILTIQQLKCVEFAESIINPLVKAG